LTSRDPLLRLLLVSGGTDRFSAPERALWELATRLPETRWAIEAWLGPEPELDELAQSLKDRAVRVERLAEPRSRWDLRGLVAGVSALRRARPSILHLHAVPGGSHHGLVALARTVGVPHVVVAQHGLAGVPSRALVRADAVTVVCEAAADELIRARGLPRARVRVVPNGADPPDEAAELPAARRLRDRLGIGAYRPLWVSAGRLEEVKGHDVLIEALWKVSQRGLDFVAALAGDGSRRAMLERRVTELGLESRVHFLGPVEALGPVLLAADAVVLPSRDETMPLSLLEAMVRARPVIASAVGGVPDVIEDGTRGLLVPAGDSEALATALARLHREKDVGRQLGMQAALHIRHSLTWAHVVERYEAVYDDVLGLAGFVPSSTALRRGGPVGGGRA
jgi:glycosyltransferase involved in cell wall biosynthesis